MQQNTFQVSPKSKTLILILDRLLYVNFAKVPRFLILKVQQIFLKCTRKYKCSTTKDHLSYKKQICKNSAKQISSPIGTKWSLIHWKLNKATSHNCISLIDNCAIFVQNIQTKRFLTIAFNAKYRQFAQNVLSMANTRDTM